MLKMLIKRVLIIIVSAVVVSGAGAVYVYAEDKEDILSGCGAECIYVCELGSGQMICERNSGVKRPMGHIAKLMTVLICAEELEKGSIRLADEVTASAYANSMPPPQIWLKQGDVVTVEELLKSIIIGNANDACVALCEKLSGSDKAHTERINKRASELGMKDTHFEDCCGLDIKTVSTAKDMCILSKCIIKYDNLTEYFVTWMDNVKSQAVELVSQNRLIRTYKGAFGLKCCAGRQLGYDLAAVVKQGEMTICTVMFGEDSKDRLFSTASNILDTIFDKYRSFSPKIDEDLLSNVAIVGGQKASVRVKADNITGVLLRKGESAKVGYKASVPESVEAPVYEGEQLGSVVYSLGDKTIAEVKICAAEDVEKMDILFGIYKCLCNLFKL